MKKVAHFTPHNIVKPIRLQLQLSSIASKQVQLPRLNHIDRQKLQKYTKNKQRQEDRLSVIRNKIEVLTGRSNRYKSHHSKKGSTESIQYGNPNKINSSMPKSTQGKQANNNKQNINVLIKGQETRHTRNNSLICKKQNKQKQGNRDKNQNNDKIEGHLKVLFNHLQNKLKSVDSHPHSHSVDHIAQLKDLQRSKDSLLLSSSLALNTNQDYDFSKSYIASPRDRIFDYKQRANKCVNNMIANIPYQMHKLDEINSRNETLMGSYMEGQLGLLELQLYKRIGKNKTI